MAKINKNMFSDANLSHIVSQAPIVLFAIDKDGIFKLSLGKGLETLGLKQNEVVGMSVYDVYQDMPEVVDQVEEALKGNTTTKILKIGGAVFQTSMSPNLNENNKHDGIIGIATDITSKVELQQELKKQNELFEIVTTVSKDVIWTMDLEGHFLYFSPNVSIIRGYNPDEVIHQTLEDVIYEDDLPQVKSKIKEISELIKKGYTDIPTFFLKIRMIHAHGHLVDTEVQINCVFDENGDFKFFLGGTRDISDRAALEKEKEKAFQKYKLLFEFANDGIFYMRNYKFFDANKKTCDMLGYSKEELCTMHPADFSPEFQSDGQRSFDKAKVVIDKAMQGDTPDFEWIHLTKSKEEKTMHISLSTVEYEGIPTVIGLMRDISSEKQVLQQLQESENRFALALDASNDGLWDWNMTSNTLFISKKWKEIIGYEEHELKNSYETWEANLHPDDKEFTLTALKDYVDGKVDRYEIEFRMRHKLGHYVFILAKGKLVRDENGTPIRMLGTHTDISERKKLQDNITQFFKNSVELVSITTRDGKFVSFNPMWTKVLGWSEQELLSKPFLEIVHKDDISRTVKEMEKLFSGHIVYDFRNRYVCKDGTYKWLSWHSRYLKERDLVFANARDITSQIESEKELLLLNTELENRVVERTEELKTAYNKLEKALQAEKRLNEMQAKFINTISHEYKTPITAISTSAEILKYYHESNSEVATKNIDRIIASTQSLSSLIENVINYQNILDGKYKPRLIPIEINTLVKSIVNQWSNVHLEKYSFELETLSSDINLMTDKASISQILGEFISNAMKYSPLHTKIKVLMQETEDKIHLSVEDKGIGIKEDEMQDLFTPFFKSQKSIGLKPGTGIGLAVVKKLADSINAEISLKSTLNMGSTFTLSLNKY